MEGGAHRRQVDRDAEPAVEAAFCHRHSDTALRTIVGRTDQPRHRALGQHSVKGPLTRQIDPGRDAPDDAVHHLEVGAATQFVVAVAEQEKGGPFHPEKQRRGRLGTEERAE